MKKSILCICVFIAVLAAFCIEVSAATTINIEVGGRKVIDFSGNYTYQARHQHRYYLDGKKTENNEDNGIVRISEATNEDVIVVEALRSGSTELKISLDSEHYSNQTWTPSTITLIYNITVINNGPYKIYFDGNGSTGGSMEVMQCMLDNTYTLSANSFTRSGNTFDCWNTKADGSGIDYADGASIRNLAGGGGSIRLYAIWNSNDKQIPQCDVKIGTSAYTYDGTEKKPAVTVRDGHTKLIEGTDFTAAYANNRDAGTASVTVTGMGNYSSSQTINYTINKANQTVTASINAGYINIGESAAITVGGIGVISYVSSDPAVATVSENGVVEGKSEGNVTITVTAAGNRNYNAGSKTISIDIYVYYGPEMAGSEIEWSLNNGVLRLTGTGEMFDWPRSKPNIGTCDVPWYEQRGSISSVIISNGITKIGQNAFKEITGITEITVPDSVTSIGEYAFAGCSGLQTMTLPFVGKSRMAASNYGLFGYIFGTSSVTGMTGVQQYYSASSSITRYLPSGLRRVTITGTSRIPNFAFDSCSMLTEIDLPSSLTSIGAYAFTNCSGIDMFRIPASVTSIGDDAFYECSGLAGVYITDLAAWCGITFTSFKSNPVYYAKNLYLNGNLITNLNIPAGVQAINNFAFINAENITGISIPDSVTLIGKRAFNECSGISEITLSDNLTSIGEYAFAGCLGITEITIPDSMKSIGQYAFSRCSGITEITVPDSVTWIGEYAFSGCSGLQMMTLPFVGASRDASSSSGLFGYIFGTSSVVTGLTGVQQYYSASSSTTRYIPSGLRRVTITGTSRIPNFAFDSCSMLTEIDLPSSLTSIGAYAFTNCSGINMIRIPASVTSIGDDAFYECSGLTGVYITDLAAWSGITFTSFKSNPVYYAKNLYLNGNLLTNLNIPTGVQVINSFAFINAEKVSGISIPESVTSIGKSAFQGCSGITEITIPDSVTSIGENAFAGCSGLQTITLPFVGASRTAISSSGLLGYIFGTSSVTGMTGVQQYYDSSSSITKYLPSGLRRVTITGTSRIPDYAFYNCSMLTEIDLPASLTEIGLSAFENCSGITMVRVPASVTSIGSYAFWDCRGLTGVYITDLAAWCGITFGSAKSNPVYFSKNLYLNGEMITNLNIPAGVQAINNFAFYNAENITGINIPDSVTSIGRLAFYGCTGITEITLSDGLTSIGEYAFQGCSEITEITVPDSVTSIGEYAFEGCSGITEITLSDNLTSIGKSAFQGCSGITEITLSDSLTSIGEYAFSGCLGLQTITLPFVGASRTATSSSGLLGYIFGTSSVTGMTGVKQYYGSSSYTTRYFPSRLRRVTITETSRIPDYAFYNCSILTEINLPSSLTSIGSYAFENCSGITMVSIPAGVTSIGQYALAGCSGITEITIPDSVTSIGQYAFDGCSGITEITVPDSVTSIGEYAFARCSGLQTMTLPFVGASRMATSRSGLFGYIFGTSSMTGLTGVQQYYDSSSSRWSYLPSGLRRVTITGTSRIPDYAFYGCKILTEIDLPSSVTSIGSYAFYNCIGIDTIRIPAGVTSIGTNTFYGCSGLTGVYITDLEAWCGITFGSFSSNPVYYARNLYLNGEMITNLNIPAGIQAIKNYAFYNADNIIGINIPVSVTSIGQYAFDGCSGITEIIIPDSVTSIGQYAFQGCSGITEITVPDSVTSIGRSAFDGCSGLQTIAIPFVGEKRTATSHSGLFGYIFGTSSKTGMTSVEQYYDSSSSSWSYLPSGLRRVTITGTSRIPDYAFYGCRMLTEIDLPASVTSIGSYAFYNCIGIDTIRVPAGVTSIGTNAFYGCSGLTGAYITDLAAWCGITFGSFSSNPVYYASNLYLNGEMITNLNIPAGIQAIKNYAFYNAENIIGISIPDSVTSIGEYAFAACSRITEITVPDSVTSIGEYAFAGCSGLQTITLPFVGASRTATSRSGLFGYIFGTSSMTGMTGVQQYYDSSYSRWSYLPSGLRRVTITGTSRIPDYAFYGCTMLNFIELESLVDSFGTNCFYGCTLTVSTPFLMDPSLAQQYGGTAVTWNFDLASIRNAVMELIPDQYYRYPAAEPEVSVSYYDTELVKGTDYTVVYQNNGAVGNAGVTVTGIGNYTGNLTAAFTILPQPLTDHAVIPDIPNQEYNGSPLKNLLKITSDDHDLDPKTDFSTVYRTDVDGNTELQITGKGNYTGTVTKTYKINYSDVFVLPDISSIYAESFSGSGIEYMVIPDSCTEIGSKAFADCGKLFRIWIPGSVTTIAGDAFSGNSTDMVIIAPSDSKAHEFALARGFGYEEAVTDAPGASVTF